MTLEQLRTIWFVLVFVLLAGYAVLDGFDLGVGMLHLLARGERQRRISINAIAPVWDGNEVWLLAAGSALFGAFPSVYATVFTCLYLAVMALLVALILRAVSMEFRSKVESPAWKALWDLLFFIGSLLPPLILGVALGNVLQGLPFSQRGVYLGTFLGLLNPYALLIGALTVVTFMMHGALYLIPRTDLEHQHRLRPVLLVLWGLFAALLVATGIVTYVLAMHLIDTAMDNPPAYVFFPLTLICAVSLLPLIRGGQFRAAFLASSIAIVSMIGLAATGLYPLLLPNLTSPRFQEIGLTISNSSSSAQTLGVMLIIALIGMPLVLAYTTLIHWAFKGKVELNEDSY